MGVIYKLKAEIKDFILEKKKAEPNLSCRQFTSLVRDKFQIKVSKSSINFLIKETGLSMPVGRRGKKKRHRPAITTKPEEETMLLAGPVAMPVALAIASQTTALWPVEKLVYKPADKSIEKPVEKPAQAKIKIESPVEKWLKAPLEAPGIVPLLLKAADYLLGGSFYIAEAIGKRLNILSRELLPKIDFLLYDSSALSSYLDELQEVRELGLDISRIVSTLFQEVRAVKVSLSDGNNFYLDGQFHTIWSAPYIPYAFSTTIYNIKSYIDKYFQKNQAFVLFTAPGYDAPSKEFFDFILSMHGEEKSLSNFILYGNKLEEIEVIPLEKFQKRLFIFGFWPWQFGQFRALKSIGEFKPFHFAPANMDLYLADIEMELMQPNINPVREVSSTGGKAFSNGVNKKVTLTGCALKINPKEKIKLVILSNFLSGEAPAENLASAYLSHWPNLEEGFQDFSQKIELFTYTAGLQQFFSPGSLDLTLGASPNIKSLFVYYLRALDAYVRWHFLALGYETKDFSTTKEQFYSLKAEFEQEKDCLFATFQAPPEYPWLKDLAYVCRRVNEREIMFPDGRRLWLSL